ncbi:Solute carrier 7 member 3 [Chamberlinius hualienensis]
MDNQESSSDFSGTTSTSGDPLSIDVCETSSSLTSQDTQATDPANEQDECSNLEVIKSEWEDLREDENRKKSKMRTASDVISRILWDPDLPTENFSVGYLDRFVGLTEKPFHFFSWEDLASVDNNVLAIPKHRIVYFKYRDVKVWDKNQRLDLVFRSTQKSTDTDIRQLIKNIDDEYEAKKQMITQEGDTDDDDDDDDDFDDDSDSDVHVTGFASKTSLNIPPGRPNYFLAIRVTHPEVIKNVQIVKNHICEREPRLRDLMMPDAAMHITMAMLKLDDTAEIANANQAVQDCKEKLADYFREPIVVRLKKMAMFNGYVLYVEVDAPPLFYQLHKALLQHLGKWNVRLAHEFDFVPHMTILKLTRSRGRQLQNPFVDPFVYVDYKEHEFGEQSCDNLHLCEIGVQKRGDGFYNCASEIYFT